jgi:hypothetical protein
MNGGGVERSVPPAPEAAAGGEASAGLHEAPPLTHLRDRVGQLRQVCRIDRLVHDDGPARGSRLVRLVSGGGLEVELHPDRCLDIGHVTIAGQPVAWSSPSPVSAPWFVEHQGDAWRRTFAGGLLTTCGLDQFGAPSVDRGVEFGLHGRASSLPAQHLNTEIVEGRDGDVRLVVSAEMRQAQLYGENLVLRRHITSHLGATGFVLEDEVTNEGSDFQPHLLLYHLNLGWPLLGDETSVEIPSSSVHPRDEAARRALGEWSKCSPPVPGWQEQVLRHDFDRELVRVTVRNARTGLALHLELDTRQLPHVFQWRQFGRGEYVLGVEPANAPGIAGRGEAREAGQLPLLEPGESRRYRLAFELEPAALDRNRGTGSATPMAPHHRDR